MILAILHQNGSWANDGDIIDFNKESFENYYISVELK
jgi:hypothetical protein